MLYYKSAEIDQVMLHQSQTTPRYAGLARKALSYYLGDKYNPETFDIDLEYIFRQMIKGYVKLKVFDKQPYDWPFIDNFFRRVLNKQGYDIPYDESAYKCGYNGVIRSELPKYHA